MSQLTEQKTKKRKNAPVDSMVAEPSSKRSKTGKVKDKNGGRVKEGKKKSKGKAPAASEFNVVSATLALSIPPVFASKPREGAEEMLDSMVMRYVPALQGVMLAHDNLQFTTRTATIKGDCPFANCTVSFDSTVWSPHVGMKLVGKINLCSPDHVALLVHRTFNVSIPRHHIPTDRWEFEYGPAENDPEFGAEATEGDTADPSGSEAVEGSGRWVHKITAEKLGGEDGLLEFTVIGLTIANQMLSLVGSIQSEPFSPEHVPDNSISTVTTTKRRTAPEPALVLEDIDLLAEQVESDEELDTFAALGRVNDAEAAMRQQQRREAEEEEEERKRRDAEEAEEKKEKKRKRKAERAAARDGDGEQSPEKKKKKKSKETSS